MKECSKSISRRLSSSNFLRRYFVGDGLDIGGKPDPLVLYLEFFPLARSIRTWDLEHGDAQYLTGVPDETYDFVHSSHCLEHLIDPLEGLRNWVRVIRPGGYLVVIVPDEDLYEQMQFPSTYNKDHKWTFTICKSLSWSLKSVNVIDLLVDLGNVIDIEKIELLNSTYRYDLPRYDQTLTPVGESGIEFVVRKRSLDELERGGRSPSKASPDAEIRLHLNQYRDDMEALKNHNARQPPFANKADL